MNILERLNRNTPLLFDGAMGTMLMKYLQRPRDSAEENLLHPETVKRIHGEYLAAGSDVITANTFGAYKANLYDIDGAVVRGVSLAREAVNGLLYPSAKYVALDIGSLGELLEPYGEMTEAEAAAKFKRVIKAGAQLADLILIETFADLDEARIAYLAAREYSDLPVFITLSFNENKRTFMGASVADYAKFINTFKPDAAGFNCGAGPDKLLPLVQELSPLIKTPLMVQPNAGTPSFINGAAVYTLSPEDFAAQSLELLKAGAQILGGCCGTEPGHIRELKKVL